MLFGKSKSRLGVDIGSANIKIVQLRPQDGKFILETYGLVNSSYQIASKDSGAVVQTAQLLKNLIAKSRVTTDQIVASLPNSSVFTSVIEMPKIPDSELASLYSAATGFISMTKYEGFGLPFLEAMACKCPVMGLDIPVLQEICAGNAILIPDTEEAFSLGLKALATRDERSIDRAYEHARSFTWEKTASNVASVLEEALR